MAKWEQKTLAESGIISAVGKQATAAIESVSAVLELISGGAEIAKLFLSALGNPLAALIKALADEIIKALNDYKELGFYALVINPFDENYGGKIKGEYGLEMVTDDNGNPYFKTSQVMNPDSPFDGFTFTVSESYRETLNLDNLSDSMSNRYSIADNYYLNDLNLAQSELNHYFSRGGQSVVDVTVRGIGRDPLGLFQISRLTGINIIMGTGWYVPDFHPIDMSNFCQISKSRI